MAEEVTVRELELLVSIDAIERLELEDEAGTGNFRLLAFLRRDKRKLLSRAQQMPRADAVRLTLLLEGDREKLVVDRTGSKPRIWKRLDRFTRDLREKGIRLGRTTVSYEVLKDDDEEGSGGP